MSFTKFLLHLLVLEVTLYFVCAQNVVISADEEDEDDEDFDNSTISYEDDDAASQLMGVQTLAQLLPLLRRDGHSVTWDDMFSEYTDSSGKVVIEGGGRMAEPDDCSPRNSTVRLNLDSTEHNIIYFPRCTKIERCGGCCASPHLRCHPAYTERVSLKVVKAEIPYPGSPHLIYKGFAPAIVERHVSCRVVCTLTRQLCGPRKVFLRNQCKCRCRRMRACSPPTVWDPEDCSCKCQSDNNEYDCCRGRPNCGLVLDPVTCQCGVENPGGRMFISSNVNITDEAMDNYFSSRNISRPDGEENGEEGGEEEASDSTSSERTTTSTTPTPTTTTTTTTMTTTSTTTTSAVLDPCLHYPCPRMFLKLRRNNRCVCQPRRRRRLPFRRNRHRGRDHVISG